MSDSSDNKGQPKETSKSGENISEDKESKLKECVAMLVSDDHQEKRRNTLETASVADPFVPKLNTNVDFENM